MNTEVICALIAGAATVLAAIAERYVKHAVPRAYRPPLDRQAHNAA